MECELDGGNNTGVCIGGIVAQANQSIIRNCSVTNLKAIVNRDIDSIYLGGIMGNGEYVSVTNCFAQGIDFNVTQVVSVGGIGGIVGRNNSGKIQYCYSTGNIKADGARIGGIYGNVSSIVKNNYSLVNIQAEADYIGGIGGYDGNTGNSSTSYNLYIGNIYNKKTTTYTNRIIGSNTTELYNYAYNEQLIDGYVSKSNIKGTNILEKEELFSMDTYKSLLEFDNNFNYDGINYGILPKLYNANRTELLPNQIDNKILEYKYNIDSVKVEKSDVNQALIRVVIDNPNSIKITGIEIEYMNVQIQKNENQDGKTYLDLIGVAEKAYDNYKITSITCEIDGEKKKIEQQAKVEVQFYKEIKNIEDWQAIDPSSLENYRLTADLDFKNVINPKINIKVGRLEAGIETKTIKNLDINLDGRLEGLIKEVRTSINNINFENINITNTISNQNYTGIIAKNLGNIENLKFKDIKIDAKNMNNVAMIAYSQSSKISNIYLENIECYGKSYTAGLVARTKDSISNVEAKNVKVESTQSSVGAVAGECTGFCNDITVSSSNIKGLDYVGAIFGYGMGWNLESTNNVINGRSYVGGVAGKIEWNGSNKKQVSKDNQIYGTGYTIGGIAGFCGLMLGPGIVSNCIIEGTSVSSNGVGGIFGYNQAGMSNCYIMNSTIKSKGSSVGAILGILESSMGRSFAENCTVEGYSYIGGAVGQYKRGSMDRIYNNSNVIATSHGAGGLVGYLNNKNMTNVSYTSSIKNCYVAGAQVTSISQVGGLIGCTEEDLYNDTFYSNNYIEAYLESQNPFVSMGIGNNLSRNSNLGNTYIYKYSTINGEFINEYNDSFSENQYLNSEQLKTNSTYTNILKWSKTAFDYNSLKNNKYPYIAGVENHSGLDIPTDPIQTRMAVFKRNIDENIKIPNMNIYVVDVNKINIEFSEISPKIYFTYEIDNNESERIYIDKKTYTFNYDFITPVKIKISNGITTKIKEINPNDTQKQIENLDNECYFLSNETLYKTDEVKGEKFVNIYKGKVLSKDGYVYDLRTLEKVYDYKTEKISYQEEKPLKEYEYENMKIYTYGSYSIIKTEDKQTERNQRIFIKNGKLSIIDGNLDMVIDGIIIDNYNEKEYQTILGTDGKMYDLKEKINYPDDFENVGIKNITNNLETESKLIIVQYENGRIYIFNYITGEKIYDNEIKVDISLIEYIKDKMNIEQIIIKDTEESYKESKNLEQKLTKMPIEKLMETIEETTNTTNEAINKKDNVTNTNTNTQTMSYTNNKYISVYDSTNEKFVVYNTNEIFDMDKEEIVSENVKIESQIQLSQYYFSSSNKQISKKINGLIWIIITIIIIMISLVILYKRRSS